MRYTTTIEGRWQRSGGGRVDPGDSVDDRMDGGGYISLGLIFSRGVPEVLCDSDHLLLLLRARTFLFPLP